jgi:hypothetical protein
MVDNGDLECFDGCDEAGCYGGGSGACFACRRGYFRNDTSGECIDIDECLEPSTCTEGFLCVNNKGNFSCECVHPARVEGNRCVQPPPKQPGEKKKKTKKTSPDGYDDEGNLVSSMDSISINGDVANFDTKPKKPLCHVCKAVGKKFEEVRCFRIDKW